MFSHSYRFALVFVLILCLSKNAAPHVTPLIHYRSVHSPVFEPSLSMVEASQVDLERSILRGLELWNASSRNWYDSADFVVSVSSANNAFYVYIQIGTPQIGQYVIMDTGSSLFWIYGKPCTQNAPAIVFDPKGSSSFRNEYCNTSSYVCSRPQAVVVSDCADERRGRGCSFTINYVKASTWGYLGRDQLNLGGDSIGEIVFGSATDSSISSSSNANGVLGLGGGSFSLIEQNLSPNFGYCIGNISDIGDESSKLLIGVRDDREGSKTPLMIQKSYFINLEGILIGGAWLDIDPLKVQRYLNNYTGGVLIDTGATYTFFPQFIMDQIHKQFTSALQSLGRLRVVNTGIKFRSYELLCYSGLISRDLAEFPQVVLKFQSFALMPLTVTNMFVQYSNEIFCLAFLPSSLITPNNDNITMSLLGNLAQQHQYFNYDIEHAVLDFQRMNCDTLGL